MSLTARRDVPSICKGAAALFASTAVLAGLAGAPSRAAGAASSGGSWTTYGGAMSRDSIQPVGPALHPLHLAWRFGRLDGAIYGEPLIFDRRVYVATENDTVDALSVRTGRLAWQRHLGAPVPASGLPCGDITPSVGVTSTMVIDPARHELFVSAAVDVDGQYRHEVLALSTATGEIRWRRDVDRSWWDRPAQLQRAALALSDGRVIVGFGGNYGDCAQYRGTVLAVPESGGGRILSYVVPTSREGAVWAPSGISVRPSGDLYVATGNGASTSASHYDEGDSVIELSPTLARLGVFAPHRWLADNERDGDLGSAAPMLLGDRRALIVGKEATGYLLDPSRLGGIGGEMARAPVCFSQGGDAWRPPLAYVACPGGSLTAVRVGARSLRVAWRGPPGTSGSPTLAGGLVFEVSDGTLRGLAPSTGKLVVTMPAIATEHFAAPSAGEGLLVVGGTDAVEAFVGPRGVRA
ncbi:MAG: PQQ-binding-like beta-propeller repeat protein [Actinomycetota bacterium]|nr:PQQ-binding-like beta-propeller repeat protein [Actinomycetota bacterium]